MLFVLVAAAVAVAGVTAATAAAAPAPVPCTAAGGGHYNCQWWPAGDGRTDGAPVLNGAGKRVGYLHQGTNWVVCQKVGRRERSGSYTNVTWAWTEADDLKWGWVNAIWAHGGDNDGAFAHVPACGTDHGNPPAATATPSPSPAPAPTPPATPAPPPAPPPPPAQGNGPAPVPCKAIGHGRYNCSWRVAGNGRTGGAPVLDGSGRRVGFLHQGTNWITCQRTGRTERQGDYQNDVWAWTTADNGRAGWVNALWAHGGDNNGPFGNVPACGDAHGSPPADGTTTPAPPKPKTTTTRRPCSDTRQNEFVTVKFNVYETYQRVIQSGNVAIPPTIHNQRKPTHTPIGAVQIGTSTCHARTGWQVNSPVSIDGRSVGIYRGADDRAQVRGHGPAKGWGVAVTDVHDGIVDVQIIGCQESHALWGDGVAFLAALPIPGLKYVVSVGKWATTRYVLPKLLPGDHTKCGDMGSFGIALTADRDGHLRASAAALTFGQLLTRVDTQPGVLGDYSQHLKEVDAPTIVRGRS